MSHEINNIWGKNPQESEETHNQMHECKEILYPHTLVHVIGTFVVTNICVVDGHFLVLYLRV